MFPSEPNRLFGLPARNVHILCGAGLVFLEFVFATTCLCSWSLITFTTAAAYIPSLVAVERSSKPWSYGRRITPGLFSPAAPVSAMLTLTRGTMRALI